MHRLSIPVTDAIAEQIRQFTFQCNEPRTDWVPKAILHYVEYYNELEQLKKLKE